MPKFRIVYVAVKHERTYRAHKSGTSELLDDRISFRREEAVTVEAPDEKAAAAKATSNLPRGSEITTQVHRI